MCVADICDDRDVGLCDADQIVDLPQVVHAHLQDRDLVIRVQAQHRHRKAEMIVEIARCLQRSVFSRKDGGDHILGRGLSHAPGHGYHRDPQFAAVISRQVAHGLGRIGHQDAEFSCRYSFGRSADKTSLRACLHGAGHKAVRVHALADDGDKKVARRRFSAVRLHVDNEYSLRVRIAQKLSADCLQDLFYINLLHILPHCRSVIGRSHPSR